jgi:DNA-directed RNA polymerase subunit M/transcription elongation factor TFIIS
LNFNLPFKKAMGFSNMLASELMRPVGDLVGEQIKHRPACPNCGRSMHLTRTTPRSGGLPDVRTYKCGECGVWATTAADDEV